MLDLAFEQRDLISGQIEQTRYAVVDFGFGVGEGAG